MTEQDLNVPQEVLQKLKKILERKIKLENEDHGDELDQKHRQAEIESVSHMLNKLLMEYNLSLSQVSSVKQDQKRPQVEDRQIDLNGKQTRHEAGWVTRLVQVIAKHNLCYAVPFTRKGLDKDDMGLIIIVGRPYNIELVMYFVDQLAIRIKDLCSDTWSSYTGVEKRNTFRRGFLKGCVVGIDSKLTVEEVERKKVETTTSQNTEMGLMIRSERELAIRHMETKYQISSGGHKKDLKGKNGYQIGFDTGRSMGIHGGIGSGNSQKLLN